MRSYKDTDEYRKYSKQIAEAELAVLKISNELDQQDLDFFKDGKRSKAVYRAELIEKRSSLRADIKEMHIKLQKAKYKHKDEQYEDKYQCLVDLLNKNELGYLIEESAENRNESYK